MSNHGKRMVKENLIAQIGQGGGAEYTAGTGIDITEDVISVDTETVALKSDLPDTTNYVTTNTVQTVTGKKTFEPESGETYKFDWGLTLKETNRGYETKYFYNEITNKVNGGYADFRINNVTVPANANGTVALTSDLPASVSGTNDGTNWTNLTIGSDTYAIPQGGGSSYTAGTGIDITANAISVSSEVLSGVLPTYGNTELVPTTEAEFNAWLDRLPILNTSDAPEGNIGDGKGDYFFIQGAFLIKPQGATDDKSTWYIGTTNNSSNITSNNSVFNHILVYRNADRGHCFLGCRYNQNNTTAYNSTSIKRLAATFKGDLVIETASTQAAYDYVHSYAQKVIIPHAKAGAQPLADVPTADGTYTLQATVSDGTVTITWVSQA